MRPRKMSKRKSAKNFKRGMKTNPRNAVNKKTQRRGGIQLW